MDLKNADAEDAAQFVHTLSVHRHCGTGVRVIVEMFKPGNQDSAILDDVGDEIEIVCPEAIRFQLLAQRFLICLISVVNWFSKLHFSASKFYISPFQLPYQRAANLFDKSVQVWLGCLYYCI